MSLIVAIMVTTLVTTTAIKAQVAHFGQSSLRAGFSIGTPTLKLVPGCFGAMLSCRVG